jgi:hypothetical protein
LRTKSFFQGEFKGRLPFLKFFKKEIRAYIVYPVEVRYYVPLQNKLEFVKLDDNLYGGLDAVGVNVADVEAEISEPGFAGSKLFIDIDSSKISVDEKQLILKKCWDAISRGLDEKGLPEGIEHNKIAARNLAAKAVEDILRGLDIVQPVEVRFIEKITGREVDSSWQNKFLEPFEKIFSLSQNDIK